MIDGDDEEEDEAENFEVPDDTCFKDINSNTELPNLTRDHIHLFAR